MHLKQLRSWLFSRENPRVCPVNAGTAQLVSDQMTHLHSVTQPRQSRAGLWLVSASECVLVHFLVMITRDKSTLSYSCFVNDREVEQLPSGHAELGF